MINRTTATFDPGETTAPSVASALLLSLSAQRRLNGILTLVRKIRSTCFTPQTTSASTAITASCLSHLRNRALCRHCLQRGKIGGIVGQTAAGNSKSLRGATVQTLSYTVPMLSSSDCPVFPTSLKLLSGGLALLLDAIRNALQCLPWARVGRIAKPPNKLDISCKCHVCLVLICENRIQGPDTYFQASLVTWNEHMKVSLVLF